MNKTEKYINYLLKLEYPEYSHKSDSTRRLAKILNNLKKKNNNNHSVDLQLLDLSLSENERLDRKLMKLVKESIISVGKYSFSQNDLLLNLISKQLKVSKNNILITSGCDGALRIVSRLLVHEDTKVCIPLPSLGRYEYHVKVNRGIIYFNKPEKFPFDINLKKVLKTCNTDFAEVIFLANPNNPTGIYKNVEDIEKLLKSFNGYVVLDEALINNNLESCSQLVKKYEKLIVTRSFSKLYGLAGERIGYLVANTRVINALKKLVSPFEVSSTALSLAIAVLQDKQYAIRNTRKLDKMISTLNNFQHKEIEITPTKSSTALVLSKKRSKLYDFLLNNGVKTVSCKDFRGIEDLNCVRISLREIKSIKTLLKILLI